MSSEDVLVNIFRAFFNLGSFTHGGDQAASSTRTFPGEPHWGSYLSEKPTYSKN